MNKRLVKGGIIIEMLLILAGFGLLNKALFASMNTYKFTHLTTLSTVDGTVKSLSNHNLTLHIEFLLPTNEMVAFDQNVVMPKYNVGQHVPVIYNILQPGQAALNSMTSMWFYSIIYTVPGLIFLLWGLRLFTARNL